MMGLTKALLVFAGVVAMSLPDDVLSLPLRIGAFLIFWGAALLLQLLEQRRRRDVNVMRTITAVQAKVVARRIDWVGSERCRRRAYYLRFATDTGESLEFEVSEIEYSRFEDGESGTLEYRGNEYLGLRRYDLGELKPVSMSDRNE